MKIKSYFPDLKSAKEAVQKLKSMGINNAYVDAHERNNGNRNIGANLPGASFGENINDLALGNAEDDIYPYITSMSNTGPITSGLGGLTGDSRTNYSIIVETDDNNSNEVKSLIEDVGGVIEDNKS